MVEGTTMVKGMMQVEIESGGEGDGEVKLA
jgi:hypothetical protein